nr:MAG TPA: hypothetical protein [Caudoviricetes sp.]
MIPSVFILAITSGNFLLVSIILFLILNFKISKSSN